MNEHASQCWDMICGITGVMRSRCWSQTVARIDFIDFILCSLYCYISSHIITCLFYRLKLYHEWIWFRIPPRFDWHLGLSACNVYEVAAILQFPTLTSFLVYLRSPSSQIWWQTLGAGHLLSSFSVPGAACVAVPISFVPIATIHLTISTIKRAMNILQWWQLDTLATSVISQRQFSVKIP